MNKHPLLPNTDDNTIDVEIEEDQDELPGLNLPQVIPDRLPRRIDDIDELEYADDYIILRLLYNRLFRRAINDNIELTNDIAVEDAVINSLGELTHAFDTLNDARDGKTEVHWEIAEWKKALSQ